MNMFDALSRPFPAEAISWRAQSVSTKNPDAPKAMALAYIDARDVMRRLDEVCGPGNWQCDYPHANGKTICRIGIKVDGEWIWKANGAGDTDIEAEKGAISDAFKRAAVLWGIGRYLYDLDSPWAECELRNGKWARWTEQGLAKLRRAAGSAVAPVLSRQDQLVTEDHLIRLQNAADDVQADLQAFCKFMGVTSLKTIPQSRFDEAMTALSKKKKAA
ncbi:Rad52/Rad22 family DNA repair protein [Sphingobium bisphenolivorans]|uniref:Rad52/Rad22 family DNA repair protein n=1 Tax=Sphingobium bisphenolivorans TaxID=1335760 RepID=UPI00039A66B2|nr:Rad52/Rad22 family DNA repair protein [Sphingobium bisphenolivorans]